MAAESGHLERFASRLYRRLVVLRMLEGAGLGLLSGGAIGLILVPILLYRSQSAVALVCWLLPISAAAGAAWALLRRPATITALMRADHQHGLHDLLSTAWMLLRSGDANGEFAQAVLNIAQGRSADLAPGAVMLHRLGRRSWGAIGVTTSLVLILGLISANPVDSQASAEQRTQIATSRNGIGKNGTQKTNSGSASASGQPANAVADHAGQDERPSDTNPITQVVNARDPGNSDAASAGSDPQGAGGGFAKSVSRAMAELFQIASAAQKSHDGNSGSTSATGASAASGDSNQLPPPPPWTGSAWNAARDSATAAVRDGKIPAAYAELVREYFERK